MKNNALIEIIRRYLIIAALIPVIILGVYAYVNQSQTYVNEVTDSANNALITIDEVINGFDENNRNILYTFADYPNVSSVNASSLQVKDIANTIREFKMNFTQVDELAIGLANSMKIDEDTVKPKSSHGLLKEAWYQEAMTNPNDIVMNYLNYENRPAASSGNRIIYSLALKNQSSGKVSGVVKMSINLKTLEMMVSELQLQSNGTLVVVNHAGDVIYGNYTSLRHKLDMSNALVKAIIKNGDNGINENSEDKYKVVVKRSIKTGWYLIAAIPLSGLSSKQTSILMSTSVVMLFMLLALWLLSNNIGKFITRPLDKLVEYIEKLRLDDNNTTIELAENSPKELLLIQDAMNTSMQRIQKQGIVLMQQKKEIDDQYMEINSLYEETAAMNDSLSDLVSELTMTNKCTIQALSNAIEANDHYTRGHCDRVTKLALALGRKCGMNSTDLNELELACMLHDVGKVGVPSQILNKIGRLTEDEFYIIKKHPDIGFIIVKDIPFLEKAAAIMRAHHERYDGNGYPTGLKGDEIGFSSKILCIADAFDAMTSARAYRTVPLTAEKAYAELLKGSGTQFDPELVKEFLELKLI
jgi:HD-GYP domain-containing protein (c-di-GMP phosphodiesterase class II)